MTFTPEFALLVKACRAAFEGQPLSTEQLSPAMDWALFLRLARFHRVQGLVWESCRDAEIPADIAQALSQDAQGIAEANLRTAAECRRILSAFEQAGLNVHFVKGLTLAALAYPKPMLKMGWDIDLLVEPDDLGDAATQLASLAYSRIIPGPSADLAAWHKNRKESVWSRADDGFYVELHTRLADNPALIRSIGVRSPRRDVDVARGVCLPTLEADQLFAYLCVHGASSLWFRLKWITDLAALLAHYSPKEIERFYTRSQELGAGRAPGQALLLADALYATLAELPSLRGELRRDGSCRSLCDAALRQLSSNREPAEPSSRPLGTLQIHLTQLALLPGPKFKLSEVLRQVRDAIR